jgi:hypothetical protein
MTPLRTKTGKVVAVFLFLAISILSFHKVSYLFQFFRFSLSPPLLKDKNIDMLTRSYLKNDRLDSVIKDKFLENEHFLASFAAEKMIHSLSFRQEDQNDELINQVSKKFTENMFLHHLGLYDESGSEKTWENLDALSLKLMRESRFNDLAFPTITQQIIDDNMPDFYLADLIAYLNWMENFTLSEDLLSWGFEEKRIPKNICDSLAADLSRRRRGQIIERKKFSEQAQNSSIVQLNDPNLKIMLRRNLLADGDFRGKKTLVQFWTFSDMSDSASFSKGSFYGDMDQSEDSSMRVMGFFVKKIDNKSPARGGFWYNDRIFLEDKTYAFCFKYKTLHKSEAPSFWLSYGLKEPRPGPSPSSWKRVCFVFNNSHYKLESIKPLLRMWGTGSVWFDDIGLYEVELEGASVEKDALFIQ